MRNTVSRSPRSIASNRSPVEATKCGMSIAASGSVQRTSSRSPGAKDFRALRVLSAGRGHFSPDRSNLATVMAPHSRMALSRLWFDNLRRRSPPTLTRNANARLETSGALALAVLASLLVGLAFAAQQANFFVCLRSDRASYSVGSTYFVDGGMLKSV